MHQLSNWPVWAELIRFTTDFGCEDHMNQITSIITVVCIQLALVISGCTSNQTVARTDARHGKALFAEKCAECHGSGGQGGGPTSLGPGQRAPALTLLSARNGGEFPRDYVMGVIDGYERRNHPAAAMPEFGAGDLGPVILVEKDDLATPIPADLLALASYLQSIQE
ncbi:c-type cytochrome [Leisingera sp. McT4-56]|uniref:c-type cytochrome n=1 Tax=Leisingera sp. McT4-56 TaxID=2881255 RepID=UPI001CF863C4|nr:cytochrome c [Leisingera sp. McT4-56]MCB4457867.1 cytochrome c [Leisingera sp. McT4-56]